MHSFGVIEEERNQVSARAEEHKKDQESVNCHQVASAITCCLSEHHDDDDDDDETVLGTQTKLHLPATVLGLKPSTCYFLFLPG